MIMVVKIPDINEPCADQVDFMTLTSFWDTLVMIKIRRYS